MAATGFTPISLYYSATASAVPLAANLTDGELALNTNDGKLYYKNSSGTVTLLASGSTTSGSFTNLTVTGNTTLGDASTDTVTVNGYMGVGGAANIANALTVGSPTLSGTTQRGIDSATTFGTGATTSVQQIRAITTLTAAGVYAEWIGLNIPQPQGSGYTLTNAYGLYISDQTKGTNNYGIRTLVSSGTNKWNIYASGTADNYFAGNVGIGTTAPVSKLDIGSKTVGNYGANVTISGTSTPKFRVDDLSNAATGRRSLTNNYSRSGGGFAVDDAAYGATSVQFDDGFLTFNTAAAGTGPAAERMRVDALGNVGIGTTPSGTYKLEVTGKSYSSGGVVTRTVAYADATSITFNVDTTDTATQANTQAAGTLTINAPTGTPYNGQKLIFRLQSTNVQTFAWNAVFTGSLDLTLPTASTGSSKYDYMGFQYNSTSAKWNLLARNFGF